MIVAAGCAIGVVWNMLRDNGIWAPDRPATFESAPGAETGSAPAKPARHAPVTPASAAPTPRPAPANPAPIVPAPQPQPVAAKPAPPPVRVIELLEARTLAAQGTATFLDARSANHFALGHIPRALNLPNTDFDATYARIKTLLPVTAQYVVYCTSADCDEAELVIGRLVPLGYGRLLHFKGGWNDWENARLPAETGPGAGGR